MNCKTALLTLLDQVDYIAGNCRPNEMVGAVLSKEVIALCRQAIEEENGAAGTCQCGRVFNQKEVMFASRTSK